MKDKYCDLHVHSCFSDGSDSPEELIKKAEEAGLFALTLADHNTVSGVERFVKAGEKSRVRVVPGIEFTTEYEGKELHIVGMFLPKKYWAEISDFTEERRKLKEESNIICVERLRKAGYHIGSFKDISEKNPGSALNRVHICRELMACGYIKTVSEGFETLLNEKGDFYVATPRLPALATISAIRDWQAVSVFAHPPLSIDRAGMLRFIPEAKKAGLLGIEVKYSRYDQETENFMMKLSDEQGLLKSGGSDYHGSNKPDISIGCGTGNLRVPLNYYEELCEHAGKSKNMYLT